MNGSGENTLYMVKIEREGRMYSALALASSRKEDLTKLREKMGGALYKRVAFDDLLADDWVCKKPGEIEESDLQEIKDVVEFAGPASW